MWYKEKHVPYSLLFLKHIPLFETHIILSLQNPKYKLGLPLSKKSRILCKILFFYFYVGGMNNKKQMTY